MISLRKIIRETLENSKTGEFIKSQIKHINDFKCVNFSSNEWEYIKKTNGDSYYLHTLIKNENNKWTFTIDVHWNFVTNNNTSNKGKEYEITFGPYNSLEEMVKDLNIKLKNNPIMSPELYEDDYDNNMDLDNIKLIEKLKKMSNKINSVARNYDVFSDLCKIYDDTLNLSSSQMMKYMKKNYPTSADKQTCSLILQKMGKIDFYEKMKNFVS